MSWLDLACRGLLGIVFLSAAVPKLFHLDGFIAIIDAYGLVPDKALFPAALAMVILELVAGITILCKRSRFFGLTIVFCLLLLFIAVLAYGLWLGLDVDCGCFGADDPEHLFFSDLRGALIRDLFLLLPVAFLFGRRWRNSPQKNRELQNGNT